MHRSYPSSGRRPTMRDVAKRSGVSLKTVSRVVNGEPGVRDALIERVRLAVEELDYRPDNSARSLRRPDGRTSTIGTLLEDVSNPFSATIQRAIEDVAVDRGYMVFSASLDENPSRERELVREFVARRIDGLIVAPASDDQSYLTQYLQGGTSVVCIDREPRQLDVDTIVTSNTAGACDGVRHLVTMGHRRIAFIGDRRSIVTAQQRFSGYKEALAGASIEPDPAWIVFDAYNEDIAESVVMRLLCSSNPPTAVFAAQNLVTVGTVRALRRLGRAHQVALVGFDDFPLADLLDPGVTVVAQDPTAIGTLAAEILLDRMSGHTRNTDRYTVPTNLIRRGSGEIGTPD